MEYVKLLLLSMSLITMLMMSQVSARHHGRHWPQADDTFGGADPRGNGHGRGHHGFQGSVNGVAAIPGFPMKGPPSAPYIFPQQQPRVPPPHIGAGGTAIYPGSGNIYPVNNYPQQNPLQSNNYPTNNQPTYVSNPFIPQRNTQGQGKQYEDIQNLPSIEPVTNELPANGKQPSGSTVKPTINPREFDLLYGSNLYEETKSKRQNLQPDSKVIEAEPSSFDDRILIDSAARCQDGYKLVGTVCRLKV